MLMFPKHLCKGTFCQVMAIMERYLYLLCLVMLKNSRYVYLLPSQAALRNAVHCQSIAHDNEHFSGKEKAVTLLVSKR